MDLSNISRIQLTAIILFILAVVGVLAFRQSRKWHETRPWAADWLKGFSTEMITVILTTLAFTLLVGAIQDRENQQALRDQLILQMGSDERFFSAEAVRQLRAKSWLTDGSLETAQLQGANLSNVDLSNAILNRADLSSVILDGAILDNASLTGANLSGARFNISDRGQPTRLFNTDLRFADLTGADLRGARFNDAQLEGANLRGIRLDSRDFPETFRGLNLARVDLSNVNLVDMDLTGTVLRGADLEEANLGGVNFVGADLREANMKSANLLDSDYNPDTILPDGTNWTPETDMRRFTDPDHPDFWQPDWVKEQGGDTQ
ncbi:MAG: pentapeptide repeat-containing protein [Chloroflexi bacterium]|nr:MAG: pentapeptide repeat-containing protein [Chloroflexota bacterium]